MGDNRIGTIHPLTREFSHRVRSGGAIVSLDTPKDSDLMLSTHHTGAAFLWRIDTEPKPRLTKVKEFSLLRWSQKIGQGAKVYSTG